MEGIYKKKAVGARRKAIFAKFDVQLVQIVEMRRGSGGLLCKQFRLGGPALWYYEAENFGHDSDKEIDGENDKFFQIELKQRFLRCKASLPDFFAWNGRIF
jgi:hypothetical protein